MKPVSAHIALFNALPQLYYVGGCVRNSLLNMPIDDYDMACALPPPAVMAALQAANIKYVPTGLAHGTITAVINGVGIEITSFRADIKTDGRHAEVMFGGTLEQDAARRDLTMNGLYANGSGQIIDPVQGMADARQGVARFIGSAAQRVQEDYLRILRFFRFYAWYGRSAPDAEGLAACADYKEGLGQLSRERVTKEVLKLLDAPEPLPALHLMQQTGVWPLLFGASLPQTLAQLPRADALTRLAWLFAELPPVLRLSNVQVKHIMAMQQAAVSLHKPLQRLRAQHSDTALQGALHLVGDAFEAPLPAFPLQGDDLMARGLQGAAIGKTLARLRQQWVDSDFTLSRDDLLAGL